MLLRCANIPCPTVFSLFYTRVRLFIVRFFPKLKQQSLGGYLRSSPDSLLSEAGASGELLVARIRLALTGMLLLVLVVGVADKRLFHANNAGRDQVCGSGTRAALQATDAEIVNA